MQNNSLMTLFFNKPGWLLIILAVTALGISGCEKKVEREGERISASEAERLDLEAAENALARAEFSEAMNLYDRFLSDFPRSPGIPYVHQKKGEILYWQKDYAAAEREFQFVVSNYPLRPEAQDAAWGLGLCYYQQKRWDDAVAAMMPIYQDTRDPGRRDQVGMLLAECEVRQGDFLNAAQWYARVALESQDQQNKARSKNLAVRIVDERLEQEQLETIVKRYPGSFPSDYALLRLAKLAEEKADFDRARVYIERILREHSRSEVKGQALALREKLKQLLIVHPRRIGLLLPLSGKGRSFGTRALKGALLAAGIFGGLPGQGQAELRVKDISSDPDTVSKAVEDLVKQDHVIAIVGPILPATAEAAAEKAQELKVPIISLSYAEGLPDRGTMVFRNCPAKSAQVEALLEWSMDKKGMKRFAVLYPQDSYGTEYMNLFWEGVERRGGKVTAAEKYDPTMTDFGPQIRKLVGLYYLEPRRRQLKKIKDEEARQNIETMELDDFSPEIDFEAIFIPDSWKIIAMIAPQLRYYRVTGVQLLGTSDWHSESLIKETRQADIAEAVFPDRFAPEMQLEDFERYKYKYQGAFDEPPALMDTLSYDVVNMLIEIFDRKGVSDRAGLVRELIATRAYQGVTGTISVMPNGEWKAPLYLLTFKDGRIQPLR